MHLPILFESFATSIFAVTLLLTFGGVFAYIGASSTIAAGESFSVAASIRGLWMSCISATKLLLQSGQ